MTEGPASSGLVINALHVAPLGQTALFPDGLLDTALGRLCGTLPCLDMFLTLILADVLQTDTSTYRT